MESTLISWLNRQLQDRDWGYNLLARKAGLSSGTISNVMTGRTNPGLEFCVKVAHALQEQPEHLLRLAGHLPPLAPAVEEEQEVLTIMRRLDAPHRQCVLRMLRGLVDGARSLPTPPPETDYQLVLPDSDAFWTRVYSSMMEISPPEVREKMIRVIMAEAAKSRAEEHVEERSTD